MPKTDARLGVAKCIAADEGYGRWLTFEAIFCSCSGSLARVAPFSLAVVLFLLVAIGNGNGMGRYSAPTKSPAYLLLVRYRVTGVRQANPAVTKGVT